MYLFSAACENFGLLINTEKTVVIPQPPPNTVHNASQSSANETQLQVVDNFTCRDSTLPSKIDNQVASRIPKATQAFGRLQNIVWSRHGLHLNTKLKVYKAAILTTPLYGAETWTIYTKQVQRLNPFHLSCPRRILKLRWQDRIPDTDILEGTGMLSHAETTATALERLPRADGRRAATQTLLWRRRHGFPQPRSPKPSIHRPSEDLCEASEDKPGQLGRPRSRLTDLEEDSEKWRSNLRGKPHCRLKSQTRSTQISAVPTWKRKTTNRTNCTC
nr:unnamed protein product [Spirometra erinaceieuropaei]